MRALLLLLVLSPLVLGVFVSPTGAGPTRTEASAEIRVLPIRLRQVETVEIRPTRSKTGPRRLVTSGRDRGWVAKIPCKESRTRPATPGRLENVPVAAVAKGRVFASGGFQERDLHAFDAKSGRLLWTRGLGDNGPSTVAITPRAVIVNTESCTTYGLEPATGKVMWSRWIGPNVHAAPTVVGDRLYTAHRTKERDVVLSAMDLDQGEFLWQRPIPADLVGAPVHRGGRLFLTGRDGSVTAFGLDGSLLWVTSPRASSAPWIAGGSAYLAIGASWRIGPPAVLCLDTATGRPRWTTDTEVREGVPHAPRFESHNRVTHSLTGWAADPPRPVVLDGRCYVAGGRDLVVLDAETGEGTRIHRLPEGQRFHSAPAVLGKHLLLVTLDGLMLEIEPRTGRVHRALDLERTVTGQAVVAEGRAFVVSGGDLIAVPWGDDSKGGAAWPQWGGGPGRNGTR